MLGLALLGISTAAPLIRLSRADPLAIAIWRLSFAVAIVAAALLLTGGWRQWRGLGARETAVACGGGVALALHFWSWNASIGLTTIAASVVLVNMQPLIVAGISALWLRESPDRRQWLGIAVAVAGAGVLVGGGSPGQAEDGSRQAVGNLLALAGAVAGAVYFLAGRRVRQRLDLWPYVGLSYAACLIALVLFAAVLGTPVLGQPPRELWIFAALAIGPMMLGHTGLNWALRWLPAYIVTLVIVAEPVGATLLAAAIPDIAERPDGRTLAAGALILAGVVIAARGTTPRRAGR